MCRAGRRGPARARLGTDASGRIPGRRDRVSGPAQAGRARLAALRPEELTALPTASAAVTGRASLAERLNVTTGGEPAPGNAIEVELHNPTARAWLLSAINASHQRIHFQGC
jgi:hypothetical protein